MLKKIIIILLGTLMMLSMVSCGIKQSVDEKIAEKVTEGVINKAAGDEANVDIDKGQLTINGKDGEKVTIGDSKWPKGDAANLIPKFKKGKIVSAINSDKACMIMIEQVETKDFQQYAKELKDQGFTNDVAESTSDSGQSYSAHSNENTLIVVLYNPESKALTINLEISK